jgi:DNA uptake protein ComE-like DNA-binding protein
MKRLLSEPFINWFGYSRRERRSSLILLLVIIAVAGVRYLVPERKLNIEVVPVDFNEISNDSSLPEKVDFAKPVMMKSRVKVQNLKRNLLELNTCDSASLEALPGIGPVLSARIIKYRNLLGGYVSVSQLREVYGLSPETYDMVSVMLKADSSAVKKININRAEYKQLIRMPYFEKSEVSEIVKYRNTKGRISSMGELIENKLITAEKAGKVSPYLEFGSSAP